MLGANPHVSSDLYEYGVVIGESRIHLKSDSKEAILQSVDDVKRHRRELLEYIWRHPDFLYALKPMTIAGHVPRIIRKMAESSRVAGVGPMASVAGAIADLGLESMIKRGAETAVIENGGEIAAITERPISVTLVSNSLAISGKIGFYITQGDCPIGIATSSSKTDHAISFGEADSVTVIADEASLADAAATAVCNSVLGNDVKDSIRKGLMKSTELRGVRGVLIVREGQAGSIGKLPKIIKIIDGKMSSQSLFS